MDQTDLERLAVRFVTRKVNDGQVKEDDNDVAKLRKLVSEARKQRDTLLLKTNSHNYHLTTVGRVVQDRMRLDKKEKANLDYIKRARGIVPASANDEDVDTNKQRVTFDSKAIKRARLLKLGEKLKSFRLAGISCFSVGGRPNDLGLRFDATFMGHYLEEKFYCILTGKDLTIYRHSLPYFVPTEDIAAAFLPSDPSQFCRRVSRYVCAFAARKIMTELLQKEYIGKAGVETSVSYDVITLTGRLVAKKNIPVHSIQLKFDSVLELIPNKADVTFLRSNGEMILQRVILDRIPSSVSSARFFNYAVWIKSVLDKRYYEGESSDEEDENGDEVGDGDEGDFDETQKATYEEDDQEI